LSTAYKSKAIIIKTLKEKQKNGAPASCCKKLCSPMRWSPDTKAHVYGKAILSRLCTTEIT